MFARLMGLKTISPAELHQIILDRRGDNHPESPVIPIDVNSHQSWTRAHVPGARNLDPAGYADTDLPADKNSLVVFYCSNTFCTKAPNAARRARSLGYNNVKVMSAGISGWLAAHLPTESAE